MAELLIKAKKHWMDEFTQKQIDDLPVNAKESYNARTQIGDVIVVKPDGWPWGNEECLPTFLVIKLPGVAVSDVEYLTQELYGDVEKDYSLRIEKEKWEKDGVEVDTLKENRLTTTPVAVLQDEKSYLVVGKWMQKTMLKRRKYRVPENITKNYAQLGSSAVTIESPEQKAAFFNAVSEKTS
ncbi:MAG: hypothetical protein WC750_06030 [Patescibacteria group bacterium]|jgi:hypothetical protein